MWTLALLKGFGLGGGLIVAIGAQNAFVLSNAIRKQRAYTIALTCIIIDIVLIFCGVFGLSALMREFSSLITIASYIGGAFLIAYGVFAFYRALKPLGLQISTVSSMTLKGAILTTAALSLLNPHVYLDTVILLGSIGGQLPASQPLWFALGASIASFTWFGLLVVGGKLLAPWFQSSASWQKLDFFVGLTMWTIAFFLLKSVI